MNADRESVRLPLAQFGRLPGSGAAPTDAVSLEPGMVRDDPELISQRWVRRHMLGAERVQESVELYESMGYEVKLHRLTPDDLSPTCRQCAVTCEGYVVIYTRREEG